MTSDNNSLKIYEELTNICKNFNKEVSSPIDTMKFKCNNEERYKRAMKLLEDTKIIIAEMSKPSTGQGMELQEAINLNIPIIIIAKTNSKISGLIQGCGKVIDILFYENIEEIEENLKKLLSKHI